MKLKLQTDAKLILTQALQRSLEMLQLPQLDLATFLCEEIEKNPLLELESEASVWLPPAKPLPEIAAVPSLGEHLQSQIRESFVSSIEQNIALQCMSHLDERGFLMTPLGTLAIELGVLPTDLERILRVLHTFDPPGIFARTLQEAFLLQLERQGLAHSLAYQLVCNGFDDLLHERWAALKKKFRADLGCAIQTLARLSTRPASAFDSRPVQPIYPDLRLTKIDRRWRIEPIEDFLPKFRLKTEYLHLPDLSSAQKETLRTFTASAKWLLRSLQRRRKFLLSLASYLVRKQSVFLNQRGPLVAITAAELAVALDVHESTISRALANKSLATPRGLLPLHALVPSQSNETVKDLLKRLVATEDKRVPFTDDQMVEELKKAGHEVARRTIAKYRKQLKIGSASTRKLFG